MKSEKPQIEISDPYLSVMEAIRKDTGLIKKNFIWVITAIIIVLSVGFITLLIMVGTLVIDSFHINSATYTEYSNKLQSQNDLLQTNKTLLDQNIQNQNMIKLFINNFNKK